MSRIKIDLPRQFHFSISISVRITDINYGNHVGNDSILSLLHEARMQFLLHHGYSELDIGGIGLIMRDVAIEFKREVFYGDELIIAVAADSFSKVSFDLYYKVEKRKDQQITLAATARTSMVCYDYKRKRVASVPEEVITRLGLIQLNT